MFVAEQVTLSSRMSAYCNKLNRAIAGAEHPYNHKSDYCSKNAISIGRIFSFFSQLTTKIHSVASGLSGALRKLDGSASLREIELFSKLFDDLVNPKL